MADEKNTEKLVPAKAEAVAGQNDTKQKESGGKTSTPSKNSKFEILNSKFLLKAGIMAVVVASSAGAGFGLGRLFGGSAGGGPSAAAPAEGPRLEGTQAGAEPTGTQLASATQSASGGWFYDFEPVVANLNEPGVTRYIRVTLTLQINAELDQKKGAALIEQNKPLLKNWLNIYLASQSLEDIRGNRNLQRIQSEILDAFNEKLFPDAKPNIRNVLFKEFAVQ